MCNLFGMMPPMIASVHSYLLSGINATRCEVEVATSDRTPDEVVATIVESLR